MPSTDPAIVTSYISIGFLVTFMGATGSLPRFGPGRAIGLVARSVLRRQPKNRPQSARKADADALRRAIQHLSLEDKCVVYVSGPRGVGKSLMIDSAVSGLPGVVRAELGPYADEAKVLKVAYSALRKDARSCMGDPESGALRTLFFYRLFGFGKPTVVFNLTRRERFEKLAELEPAVSKLASQGIRVIVEGSYDSLPSIVDLQQVRYEVRPLAAQELWAVPEFVPVAEALDSADKALAGTGPVAASATSPGGPGAAQASGLSLKDTVFARIGGYPAAIDRLKLKLDIAGPNDVPTVVEDYLRAEINAAAARLHMADSIKTELKFVKHMFKGRDYVPLLELEAIRAAAEKRNAYSWEKPPTMEDLHGLAHLHVVVAHLPSGRLIPGDTTVGMLLKHGLATAAGTRQDMQEIAAATPTRQGQISASKGSALMA